MFLKKGMQGENIQKLQAKLRNAGYNPGPVDGVFGYQTENAVIRFQSDNGLSVDGTVGNQTWGALFNTPVPPAVHDLSTPPRYHQAFDVFDDFRIAGWSEQNLIRCDLSAYENELQHLYFSWMTENDKAFIHHNWFGFLCHRLVAPRFQAAFGNIVHRGLHRSLKTFDGCYHVRNIRGGNEWSTHSWAIAIDLNAPWNRFGQRNFEMSDQVAQCFEDEGFLWGGRWQGTPDAMHFQFCSLR